MFHFHYRFAVTQLYGRKLLWSIKIIMANLVMYFWNYTRKSFLPCKGKR